VALRRNRLSFRSQLKALVDDKDHDCRFFIEVTAFFDKHLER
jgi:hypothetical protein